VTVAVNPPASQLGLRNAILWGRGRNDYHVQEFPGPLSIKAVMRGAAEWRVGKSRFELDAGSYLLVNDRQPYSLTVESREPVETFCVFFQRGFVEDACRSVLASETVLLDDPRAEKMVAPAGFYERVRPRSGRVSALLNRIYGDAATGAWEEVDAALYDLALGLVALRGEVTKEIGRVPALRASTREEVHRRLHLGKQALDETFKSRLTLAQIARQAHLSPFHFHRAFTAVFGETPHAYRTRRRLAYGARLLRETGQPVTEVCFETGFESPASFATLFRKRYHASPTAWRRFRKIE
jgi:AraC family transcriptional regulator